MIKIEITFINSLQLIDSPQNDSCPPYHTPQSLQMLTPAVKLASVSIDVTPQLPEFRLGEEPNLHFGQMSFRADGLF